MLMNQDVLNHAYEQIDNQILRLLLYFGGAVILTLSTTLAYLWSSWRAEQRERIELDKANAVAISTVASRLESFHDAVVELQRLLNNKEK